MSGILRLESLTKGNTLKQGDKTPLKYRLFDADGENLNIAGKSAKVRLVYPDFLTIGYEKDGLTVAQDDTVTFTIDNVIPSRIYHVEVIVDDKFIFPSRSDEAKFTIDKSSLNVESNIIEIIGVDAVVRKAVDLINENPNLIIDEDKLVNDIIQNTGIGSIEEYHQQFNDVMKELSEDKDYHSLPEIAGARGGFDTLGERLDETTSHLAQKANLSDVANISDGTPLFAGNVADMTNTARLYANTTDGLIYMYNGTSFVSTGRLYQSTGIEDKGVTENKLAFTPVRGVKGKNLFNKSDVTASYFIPYNTGVLTARERQSLSGFISAHENTAYYRTTASHTTFWDKNKNYLSGTLANSFTTPSGTCYIRISMLTSTIWAEQLELGSVATPYEEFGTVLIDLKKGSIPQETLGELSVSREEIEGFSPSVNLFNALTLKSGYVVTSGAGEMVNAEYSVSDYIPIKPLTSYTVSNAYVSYASFYGRNKDYLTTLSVGVGGDDYTITSVASAYYMRVNIRNTHLTDYMIVEGDSMPVEFVPFGTKLEGLLLEDGSVQYRHMDAYLKNKLDTIDSGKWVGKTIFTFGDSITWYDGKPFGTMHSDYGVNAKGYQSYMREKLGCTVINKGVSGNRMPQISTTIKAQNYTGVSAVTITAGANDFRVGEATEPFGTIQPIGSTFDETSFTGSLQSAIEYVLGVNPEMKIYLITPIKGWSSSGALEMPNTYPDAMKEIAQMYSLSVCDWYGTSGINTLNKTTYIGDDPSLGYYLHPTNIGYERMANILIPFMQSN